MNDIRRTPLTGRHEALGAKMAEFAGFLMPIQYVSILAEHQHTREKASIFDICHMGEFMVSGEEALAGLSRVVTHDLSTLAVGRCRYGFMLNAHGGTLDDLIIYRLAAGKFMLVVNGACAAGDFAWLKINLPRSVTLEDVSDATAKIDLQGPLSLDVLNAVMGPTCGGETFGRLPYFGFESATFQGGEVLVSRTGYTGELGYELYCDAALAPALWDALAADERVKPAGLGARDTLRLEAGLPLYGHELDSEHTPIEAGLGMFVKNPGEFIGKAALATVRRKRVALAIEGRRAARQGDAVLTADGREVGVVTSGSFAPSLGFSVALALVDAAFADAEKFTLRCARCALEAVPTDLPFYKQGTARMKTA